MRTNGAMTVYNRYVAAGKEVYQRSEIAAVAWENRKAANVILSGMLEADSVTVYIPFSVEANHLDPLAWLALVSKVGKWTLQAGDVIVRGIVTDEIHEAVVSPPSAAFTISSLKAKYDNVLVIKSVDTLDGGSAALHHWRLGAS